VLEAVAVHRDYNTISVGMIDDYFATMALENKEKIILRSQTITRRNLRILDDWVKNEPLITYQKPSSGTTALLKYNLEMASRDFCVQLLKETGVMLLPGSAMEMEGWLRIGYANSSEILFEGLKRVSSFLKGLSIGSHNN
jgi:aspartate/methionine/tyrosine aminotransferase